jgi:hypothetical protein
MEIFLLIVAVIITYLVYSKMRRERIIKQRFEKFLVPNFFTPHESYISADLNSAIAIDKETKLIGLQDETGECNYYDERYIINSEIVVGEQTTQKRPFLNIWGSYLIGKWIAGQKIGEIAAMTSKVRVDKKVNSIKLKVTVNDLTKPNYSIVFLSGTATTSQQNNALQTAEYWDGVLKVFLDTDNRNRFAFD